MDPKNELDLRVFFVEKKFITGLGFYTYFRDTINKKKSYKVIKEISLSVTFSLNKLK
jgi:hypothetical protein